MPMTVAVIPSAGSLTLVRMSWIAFAASTPMRPRSWPKISPRAASAPKIKPAIEITINSTGASENTV